MFEKYIFDKIRICSRRECIRKTRAEIRESSIHKSANLLLKICVQYSLYSVVSHTSCYKRPILHWYLIKNILFDRWCLPSLYIRFKLGVGWGRRVLQAESVWSFLRRCDAKRMAKWLIHCQPSVFCRQHLRRGKEDWGFLWKRQFHEIFRKFIERSRGAWLTLSYSSEGSPH